MEKLVEEIAKTIWATDPIYYGFLVEPTKRLAKTIITRIGKAYADGELELPGEDGRFTTVMDKDVGDWVESEFTEYLCIALRKEEEK